MLLSHYDLNVLPMSVMGLPKKFGYRGWWVGGVSSIQFIWGDVWNFVNISKPLSEHFWDQVFTIRSTNRKRIEPYFIL